MTGFKWNGSNFQGSTGGKMLSESIACYREIVPVCCLIFLKMTHLPQPSTISIMFTQQPWTLNKDPLQPKNYDLLKVKMTFF